MQRHLHTSPVSVYNCGMARENKTAHMLLRVKPSFKKQVESIAAATNKNVTETVEAAIECYASSKKVRDALAKAPQEGE